MKKINFKLLVLVLSLYACSSPSPQVPPPPASPEPITQGIPKIQTILDSHSLEGAVLIYDVKQKSYYSNNFPHTKQGYLPASTFKIPNSIIGLETGILSDENHLFPWDGTARRLKSWEKDLTLAEAFHASCVPCYRELARKVGLKKMQEWTNKLGFGQMVVTEETLDLFWLDSPSRISQSEQIDFLSRFYHQELPISQRTYEIMKQMIVREKTAEYQLSGKTGLAIRSEEWIGWFVGYVEKSDGVYFFATNLTEAEAEREDLSDMRIPITLEALRALNIIPAR